jgi:hypothetical protein
MESKINNGGNINGGDKKTSKKEKEKFEKFSNNLEKENKNRVAMLV